MDGQIGANKHTEDLSTLLRTKQKMYRDTVKSQEDGR